MFEKANNFMKRPNFSYFPKEEYERRYRKASKLMEKYNIDLLLVTSKENISYFMGYDFGELEIDDKYFYCFGILPKDMSLKPTLLVGEGNEGTASMSWVEDKRFFTYSKKQFMGMQYMDLLIEIIKEKGLDKSNLGLELGPGMNLRYDVFKEITEQLKRNNFIDASKLIWDVRKIKSNLEVEAIKEACRITCSGYVEGFKALKEGISCSQIWKEAEKVWLKYGYEEFVRNRKKSNWCANGHGIGLDIHEPPTISLAEKELLKSGMVVTIEAFNTHNGTWPLKNAEWWYVIENLILVKKNGYEILSDVMGNDLWVA